MSDIPSAVQSAVLKTWGLIDSVLTSVMFRDNPTRALNTATDAEVTTWAIQKSNVKIFIYDEETEEESDDEGNVAGKKCEAIFRSIDLDGIEPTSRAEVVVSGKVWTISGIESPPANAIFIAKLTSDG